MDLRVGFLIVNPQPFFSVIIIFLGQIFFLGWEGLTFMYF